LIVKLASGRILLVDVGVSTGLETATSLIGVFMDSDFRAAHSPHLQFETQVDVATPFQRLLQRHWWFASKTIIAAFNDLCN
jgi:hypothetical protein